MPPDGRLIQSGRQSQTLVLRNPSGRKDARLPTTNPRATWICPLPAAALAGCVDLHPLLLARNVSWAVEQRVLVVDRAAR
eukprot:6800307-Pyramimonas_sp.AAC.1